MKISARYRNRNNTTTHRILTTTTNPLTTLSNILDKSPPDTTHIDCRITLDPATPEAPEPVEVSPVGREDSLGCTEGSKPE